MNERLAKAIERYHAKNDALWALAPMQVLPHRFKRWSELALRDTKQAHWDEKRENAWISNPNEVGLRLVGYVPPEAGRSYRDNSYFMKRQHINQLGWYTDPDGYFSKDGDGLVYGAVYQLPARNCRSRLVAGLKVGGDWGGNLVDLSRLWETIRLGETHQPVEDTDAAHDAAFAADKMAENFAEEEREYQDQHREEEDD